MTDIFAILQYNFKILTKLYNLKICVCEFTSIVSILMKCYLRLCRCVIQHYHPFLLSNSCFLNKRILEREARITTNKLLSWFYQNVRIRTPYDVSQEYTNCYYDFSNVVVGNYLYTTMGQHIFSSHYLYWYHNSTLSASDLLHIVHPHTFEKHIGQAHATRICFLEQSSSQGELHMVWLPFCCC